MKRYRLLHLPTSRLVIVDESFAAFKQRHEDPMDYNYIQTATLEEYINLVNYGLEGLWIGEPSETFTPIEFTNKRHFKTLLKRAKEHSVALFYCIGYDLGLVRNEYTIEDDSIIDAVVMCKDEFDIIEVKT